MSFVSFGQVVYGGRVVVNGKTYNMPDCSNVSVIDGVIVADGQPWTDDRNGPKTKDLSIAAKIEIHVHVDKENANLTSVKAEHGSCVIVHGPVAGDVRSVGGAITVHGNVQQDVSTTNGGISIGGSVGGNVSTTNGSVRTGTVRGRVTTVNGSIVHG